MNHNTHAIDMLINRKQYCYKLFFIYMALQSLVKFALQVIRALLTQQTIHRLKSKGIPRNHTPSSSPLTHHHRSSLFSSNYQRALLLIPI